MFYKVRFMFQKFYINSSLCSGVIKQNMPPPSKVGLTNNNKKQSMTTYQRQKKYDLILL